MYAGRFPVAALVVVNWESFSVPAASAFNHPAISPEPRFITFLKMSFVNTYTNGV